MLLGVLGATIGIIALQFISNASEEELVAAQWDQWWKSKQLKT